MTKLVINFIRAYQLFISPMFGPSCRYYPSCSQYAVEAVQVHGILKGSYFALRRVLRCHPGCDGGYDPVPETELISEKQSDTDKKSDLKQTDFCQKTESKDLFKHDNNACHHKGLDRKK